MKKKIGIWLIIIVVLILIAVIIYKNITNPQEEENNKFKIVTTFYPIYVIAQNITQGAQDIELVNMTDIEVRMLT